MPVSRQQPLHLQIAGHYSQLIAGGQLAAGDRLPTVQQVAADWGVSHQTAVRAMEYLRSGKLITTSRDGSAVAGPRLAAGPQQRLAMTRYPESEQTVVHGAELIPAPAYVAPILGLLEVKPGFWPVIRREQVSYESGERPYMLEVQWFPAEFSGPVPELLAPAPLAMGEAIALIGQRAGRVATRGIQAREAREIRDDGREGPLLHLEPGSYVLAEAWQVLDGQDALAYGEYILLAGRVTENEFTI